MRTVYDLYHWDHPDAAATVLRGGFESAAAAAQAAGHPALHTWEPTADENGWTITTPAAAGFERWGVFERQQAETDAERVQLALELLAEHGQTDGDHHKAWVIDQTVRILAGDRYEHFIAEYRSEDGDGEPIYTWDEGIAP